MNFNLHFDAAATKVAIWTATNPLASRLLMLALPVTLAAAAAVITRHPIIIAPACGGSGSGGLGGSC
jgi:hypothetical protein